ncbi:MAG: NERD domain-containing protein [Acidobacteriia bacterium]|nr:NERD domain-containing protein [Terriglobia bacterium]
MALWDRISRVLASFRREQLGERELVGIQGEEYATEVIAGVNPQCHIPNAVVPSANGGYCETDRLVLVGGTIFVVEVKNYKGRIVWEDASERRLMQWKIGHYGETILPKPAKNPLAQAPELYSTGEGIPVRHLRCPVFERVYGAGRSLYTNCGYYGNSQPGQRADLRGRAAYVFCLAVQ